MQLPAGIKQMIACLGSAYSGPNVLHNVNAFKTFSRVLSMGIIKFKPHVEDVASWFLVSKTTSIFLFNPKGRITSHAVINTSTSDNVTSSTELSPISRYPLLNIPAIAMGTTS